MARKFYRAVAAALGLGLGATLLARSRSRYDLRGKNVLVTGGGRGLGLELARVLVARGANVALVARDRAELDRAVLDLQTARGDAPLTTLGEACDLQDGSAIDAMLTAVRERLGPIDVLINNAGTIQVGPLDTMRVEDFEAAMALHMFAPLRTMLGVRDDMRSRGGGRIVNIASIGGLVSVPHLLPYSASKFALMGLSEGMRVELARDRILVTTVAPGLMRTGSPPRATFKGDHEKEYAWFAISDSLPVLSMSSERAARQIVRALEHGAPHVVLGLPAKLAALAHGIAPGLVIRALTSANKLLPSGDDPTPHTGYESQSKWAPSVLTQLSDRATADNNEWREPSSDHVVR